MTTEQIRALAEKSWEGCHGCNDDDRNFWINGFMIGYLNARIDRLDENIQITRDKITTILINGNNCEYSGLPSVESYEEDKTFKQKSKWTKINKQQ